MCRCTHTVGTGSRDRERERARARRKRRNANRAKYTLFEMAGELRRPRRTQPGRFIDLASWTYCPGNEALPYCSRNQTSSRTMHQAGHLGMQLMLPQPRIAPNLSSGRHGLLPVDADRLKLVHLYQMSSEHFITLILSSYARCPMCLLLICEGESVCHARRAV